MFAELFEQCSGQFVVCVPEKPHQLTQHILSTDLWLQTEVKVTVYMCSALCGISEISTLYTMKSRVNESYLSSHTIRTSKNSVKTALHRSMSCGGCSEGCSRRWLRLDTRVCSSLSWYSVSGSPPAASSGRMRITAPMSF